MLSIEQKGDWDEKGFFIVRGFAPIAVCREMHERVVEICRLSAARDRVPNVLVLPEKKANTFAQNPEDNIGKVFRLHRDPLFKKHVEDPTVLDIVSDLIGPNLDCFLSQFIFKNHGAMGQPWHQDSYYFAFDNRPQVGVWLAVTEATLENGCLNVMPGSHREPVHDHVPDRRPDAQYGYTEIVDYDLSNSVPVLMQPGDLLVFHSHLMHRSTDNESKGIRAAMVWHYTKSGTIDRTLEKFGRESPVHDFMKIDRAVS
ncbi:MAG TPA: phytanoyl-CoA dioxygenase family protein [Candidatus Dormibacteraeota bacterium]|nr:phytanoyl-CoA dioxygenase family protein [Candidatus Dormibacteraeota bacterium]